MINCPDDIAVLASLFLTGITMFLIPGLVGGIAFLVWMAAGYAAFKTGWLSANRVCIVAFAAFIAAFVGTVVWNMLFGWLHIIQPDGIPTGLWLYAAIFTIVAKTFRTGDSDHNIPAKLPGS